MGYFKTSNESELTRMRFKRSKLTHPIRGFHHQLFIVACLLLLYTEMVTETIGENMMRQNATGCQTMCCITEFNSSHLKHRLAVPGILVCIPPRVRIASEQLQSLTISALSRSSTSMSSRKGRGVRPKQGSDQRGISEISAPGEVSVESFGTDQ